jgi:transposase
LLSQDEARFSLIPTLRTTLGVTGHRPLVGNLDGQASLSLCGALNQVTGRLTTRLVERPQPPKKGRLSTRRYLQEAFAHPLRDMARAYPAAQFPRGVIVIDKAPGHQGAAITAVLADYPQLEWYPLPSYSPQLQMIERFWQVLRRRATHNRLFPTMAGLKQALRNSLSYYHTLKHRLLSVMQSKRNRTKSSTA